MAEIRANVLRALFIFVGITHFVDRIGGIKPSHIKEVQKSMVAHAESDDDSNRFHRQPARKWSVYLGPMAVELNKGLVIFS